MPDNRKAIYWDANCWLSYVNGIEDRLPVLDALLDSGGSASGDIRLYTSAISKVEVAFSVSEQQQQVLDAKTEELIENLWSDPDALVMVEFHDGIADSARDLMRVAITRGWSLKPLDAIHLATAKWLSDLGISIEEFHTYDGQLFRWASILGFKILNPYTSQPKLL